MFYLQAIVCLSVSLSVFINCMTAACHSTRLIGGSTLICLYSHKRHLAAVWRFSAILASDINVITYLLTFVLQVKTTDMIFKKNTKYVFSGKEEWPHH